jgi:hypothetical protein
MIKNSKKSVEERKEEFHDTFDVEEDAAITMAELVEAVGDYLSEIVGAEPTNAAMLVLLKPLLRDHHNDWKEGLSDQWGNCYSTWPLGAEFHNLQAYGAFGILIEAYDDDTEVDKKERLEKMVKKANDFLDKSPLNLLSSRKGRTILEDVVIRANNRWALDNGKPIEPLTLAEFGGISEGRIKNMMSGESKQFSNVNGKIPALEAIKWLSDRDTFYNSVWKDQRPFYKHIDKIIEAHFVPVARDGTVFSPNLMRNNGFTIGEKGDEKKVADFEEALSVLHKMPIPYWRRKNKNGSWGIVRGVGWKRINIKENQIEALEYDGCWAPLF